MTVTLPERPDDLPESFEFMDWCVKHEKWIVGSYHRSPEGICEHGVPTDRDGIPIDGIPSTTSPAGVDRLLRAQSYSVAVADATEIAKRGVTSGALYAPNWRTRIRFNFKDCRHEQQVIHEVEVPTGVWALAICVRCGEVVTRECAHDQNDWHNDGTTLQCRNCGVDGT